MSGTIADIRHAIRYWCIFLVSGTFLILFAILVLNHPVATYGALSIYFEIFFLVNGILEIIFAISSRRSLPSWRWHLASKISIVVAK